jgi:hypothetical protein
MILNDGVADTVRFHTTHRMRVALINALEYKIWKLGLVRCDKISRGVFDKVFECDDVLNEYLFEQQDKYMHAQHHT